MMRKVKHTFKYWEHSKNDMERYLYLKQFSMSFTLETEHVKFGGVLGYGKEDRIFSVLRNLVKRKHEAIKQYESFHMCIKQPTLPHISAGKLI